MTDLMYSVIPNVCYLFFAQQATWFNLSSIIFKIPICGKFEYSTSLHPKAKIQSVFVVVVVLVWVFGEDSSF